MQDFLKKIFRKDIVAIFQNILNLVQNWLKYHLIQPIWHNIIKIKDEITSIKNQTIKNKEKRTAQINVTTKIETDIIKLLFKTRLQTPIIIYQPGKVGSITVYQSLKTAFEKLDLQTPIYHAHKLNHIATVEENIKKTRKRPEPSLKKLEESRALRQEIDANQSQCWNIISLVRDPVALRVSTMFQILDEYLPEWAELRKENKLSIADLQQMLLTGKEFSPIGLSEWFDEQIKDLFNFDVFSAPFDINQGFKIYRPAKSRFSFMIIRLEDLDRVGPQAFNQFLGIKTFEILNHNIGEQKPYSQLYKEFKSVPLPIEYLETAYNTQYAHHFYTPQEIETFRDRWLNPQEKKES